MTEIDLGREIFGARTQGASSVRHGTAQAASTGGRVSVLLDGSTKPVSLACEGTVAAGQRVAVVYADGAYALLNQGGGSGGGGGSSGMFALEVDADGNLYAVYEDGGVAPSFDLEADGDLYYIIEE